ncbi:MAG: HD domain-containing protein, partial [Oscillospiraceae bacterium]|nr:HD domain-containing protein [Oscillospiraceae bacterium]
GGLASIKSLFVDSRDRLWVGTNDSGVAVRINGEFKMYGKKEGLASLSVRSIVEGKGGEIYIATTNGLAVVDNDMKLSMLDDSRLNKKYIRMLRKGGDSIYGVTMDGDVFVIADDQVTEFYDSEKMGISDIHCILPDPDRKGYAYIGNKGSELYYGQLSNGFMVTRTYDMSPLEYVNSIDYVGDMVWVCTDTGIGFLSDGKFIKVNNIPMNTSVEQMMIDYQKNLWFVSSQQGVMKIVPNQFTDLFKKYDIDDEVVYTTCLYNNKLFVGTKNRGLLVLRSGEIVDSIPITSSVGPSGEVYEDTDLLTLMNGCKIRSIIRDSKNRIWLSTFGEQGLVRYDNGSVMKFTVADGLPSDRIRTVCERKDGSYIVVCTGGVAVIRNDKIEKIYNESDGISNTEVLTAIEADNGDIILGTDGGGIYIIGQDGIMTYRNTDSGLMSDVVMRIKKDLSRGIYWIVTSNSIAYMDEDYNITTVRNFPYSNNFDLYENSRGEMWVLSSNGIYISTVDELISDEDISPIYYGMDNGLECIATSNSYSELTSDGELFISGTTGVAKVNIEKVMETVSDVKMAVPYIETDGKYVFPDKAGRFVIPSDVRKITIYSYAYNYSLVNPDVTYTLENFDSSPVTVKRSDLAPINYTNLRGGKYTFVMQIMDPQHQSSKELRVVIVKKKAFFEQLWVGAAGVLLVILLLGVFVKLYIDSRTRRFLKKENEQKELIREIVEAFAKVIDMKDKYTNGHSSRVAEYTSMLCKELGYDEETIERYYNIALLHDIGKVGVPPEVLNKAGKLTDKEFAIIKSHSALGYNTLKDISIMPELAIGAGAHHERPDGKGYPKGLKGDEIPRVAQIIAVADTFDAMYSDRPYRKRMNFEKAVSIMKEVKGTQLTEDVVDAFLKLVDKGEFRAEDDTGGGTTEDIDNIHKKFDDESKEQEQKEDK